MKRNKYEEFSCGLKNEADCEEELEEDGSSLDAEESEHFDEIDEEKSGLL